MAAPKKQRIQWSDKELMAVVYDKQITPFMKGIYLILRYNDANGTIPDTLVGIASDVPMAISTTERALTDLHKRGLITYLVKDDKVRILFPLAPKIKVSTKKKETDIDVENESDLKDIPY